jgi:hypothetical protein
MASDTLGVMTDSGPSVEIQELFLADQKEHLDVPSVGTAEYSALRERDRLRRESGLKLLVSITSPSAEDLYRVAWVLNHGDTPEEARCAHQLATQAAALGCDDAKWLSAASYDRWQMYSGKPQKYGTQIVPDGTRHRVWDTDPSTTDTERAELNVPPIADQHKRAIELTRTVPQPPMDQAPEWLKSAIARWNEGVSHDA